MIFFTRDIFNVMSKQHSSLASTNGIHSIDAAVVANTGSFSSFTAFPNKSSFDSTDVGKIVLQQDTKERYQMISALPPLFTLINQGPRPGARLVHRTNVSGTKTQGTHLALSLDMFCTPTLYDNTTMTANVNGFSAALEELRVNGGGKLIVPPGQWHFNGSPMCSNWSHITIEGEGYDTSLLTVHGLTNTIFLDANSGASEVDYCRIRQLTIYGANISGATAIRITDWEGGEVDARIIFTGTKSVGLDIRGRELVDLTLYISADCPVLVHANPHYTVSGMDHFTIHSSTYYGFDSTESIWRIVDNCDVTKSTWVGRHALVTDGGGFDFSNSRVLSGNTFYSLRHESITSVEGMQSMWTLNLAPTVRGDHNTLLSCQGSHWLIRLRNTFATTLIDCSYQSVAGTALDADGSNDDLVSIGFFNSGGAWTTVGLVPTLASMPHGDGAGNTTYSVVSYTKASNPMLYRLSQKGDGLYSGGERISLTKTTSITLGPVTHISFKGTMRVSAIATEIDATWVDGVVLCTSYGPLLISHNENTPTQFSNTNDANKLCLYNDSGNLRLINNTNRDMDVTIVLN